MKKNLQIRNYTRSEKNFLIIDIILALFITLSFWAYLYNMSLCKKGSEFTLIFDFILLYLIWYFFIIIFNDYVISIWVYYLPDMTFALAMLYKYIKYCYYNYYKIKYCYLKEYAKIYLKYKRDSFYIFFIFILRTFLVFLLFSILILFYFCIINILNNKEISVKILFNWFSLYLSESFLYTVLFFSWIFLGCSFKMPIILFYMPFCMMLCFIFCMFLHWRYEHSLFKYRYYRDITYIYILFRYNDLRNLFEFYLFLFLISLSFFPYFF